MKAKILFPIALFALAIFSCGPAAEDRERMHHRAKEFQDSIANVIKQSMDEAEMPIQNAMPVPAGTTIPLTAGQPQPLPQGTNPAQQH